MEYIEISSDESQWDDSGDEKEDENNKEDVKQSLLLEKELDNDIEREERPKIRLSKAKDQIKKLNSEWSKKNDLYLKKYQAKYRQDLLSEKDEEDITDYYNNSSQEMEDKINDIIEQVDRKPSERFYDWVDMLLSRQETKFLRILD